MVRAPGRLNLIGEHVDYSLLPVLPIAIDRALWIAAGHGPAGRIVARSAAHGPPADLWIASLPARPPGWQRYLVAALAALPELDPGRGALVLVDGDLPATGGLSSSSALTLGLLCALDALSGLGLGRDELVRRAIVAERRVGVETGGMDQTAIAFAEPGHALRIDFDPPARRSVAIPPDVRFVAAYSGSAGPKADLVRDAYNARVVACRIAADHLAREAGLDAGETPVLGCVLRQAADARALAARADALPAAQSAREAARSLAREVERFTALSAARFDADREVPVRACARHVLAEASRVDCAERALEQGDLPELGRLLDASQASLGGFGASSPALDRVVRALREAGAFGARLTGAGFGGYAFGAFPPERVEDAVRAGERAAGGPAFPVRAERGLELLRQGTDAEGGERPPLSHPRPQA